MKEIFALHQRVKSKSIKIKLKSNSVICKAKQFEFCFLKIFKNGKQSTPSSDRMNNNVEFLKKLKNQKCSKFKIQRHLTVCSFTRRQWTEDASVDCV